MFWLWLWLWFWFRRWDFWLWSNYSSNLLHQKVRRELRDRRPRLEDCNATADAGP